MSQFHPFFEKSFKIQENTAQMNKEMLQWYLDEDVDAYLSKINTQSSTSWLDAGKKRSLEFFHQTAEHVPAYADFLAKHEVDHKKIQTFVDFASEVPLMDKKNYILQYSLADMSWDGKIHANTITSFSSGTSGASCYWPRAAYQDIEGAFQFEQFFSKVFEVDKKSSLIVICFALGNYVAGTYVLSCLELMAMKGYKVMIVSPGINQADTFRMIKKLSPEFEQTILCGYPPLLRDIIHAGTHHEDIIWSDFNVRFLFSSELFSEVWRDRVLEEAGTSSDYRNSTNLYGTADATLFGLEHPLNISVKKRTLIDSELRNDIFHSDLTPTFIQYNPLLRFFEVVEDELVLTSQSGIPLIRYNLHDKGGIITHEEVVETCNTHGFDVLSDLQKHNQHDTVFHFPHVYVFGRTDGAVSLYGLLVYPEYVKSGLEDESIYQLVTGKFTLAIEQDETLSPILVVHTELAEGVLPTDDVRNEIYQVVVEHLRSKSAEYNRLYEAIDSKAYPHIELYEFGKDEMFEVKIKQTWIKRT